MNEFDSIEQLLGNRNRPTAPPSLRADVFRAINVERQLEDERLVVRPNKRFWYQSLERVAVIAAPCLLVFSLFTFTWVHWSTGKLLSGHRSETTETSNRYADQNRFESPRLFFAHHVNLLKKLQVELFHETFQEAPEVDRHWSPLGRVDRDPGFRIS